MVFWLPWSLALLAWGVSLLLLGPHDLAWSRALADPGSLDGWIARRLGELPGWACVLAGLGAWIGGRRPGSRLRPWRRAGAAVVVQAVCLPLAATQLLKHLWGRVRPRNLAADLSNYTSFLEPAGAGAGESFPSGHAAMAAVMASLPFFLWSSGRRRWALAAGAAVGLWGLFVAWGRVRAGAHFPTDTWFSLGLGWLAGALLGRWAAGGPAPRQAL